MANARTISRKQLLARLGLPEDATDQQLHASLDSVAESTQPGASRKHYTDRLGLPQDATNEQILAAVDKVIANAEESKALAAARAEEDRLMSQAGWGDTVGAQRRAPQ